MARGGRNAGAAARGRARTTRLLELGLAARDHCDSLATALRESIGADIGLWREGIAHVAGDEKEAGELWSKVAWQRQQGHLADWLDAGEVKSRWPWLGPTAGALWAPHEGALEPERLVAALREDARRLGAMVEQDAATAIESRGRPGDRGDRQAGPLLCERRDHRGGRLVLGDRRRAPAARRRAGAGTDGRVSVAPGRAPGDRVRARRLLGRARRRGDRGLHHGVRRLRPAHYARRRGARVRLGGRALPRARAARRRAAPGPGSGP